MFDEFFGCFFSDSRNARDVVGCIAPEPEDVDDLFGRFYFPLATNAGGVEQFVVAPLAARFPHGCGVGYELSKIFIGRHHVGVNPSLEIGAVGKRANDIVGLVAWDLQHRDSHGSAKLFDVGDGDGEFLGHFVALCLVFGVNDVPRGGFFGVEGYADVGRVVVVDQIEKHVCKSENG